MQSFAVARPRKKQKGSSDGVQDPSTLLELISLDKPFRVKEPPEPKKISSKPRVTLNRIISKGTAEDIRKRKERRKILEVLAELALSREEKERAYGRFARTALEGLSKAAQGSTFSFANWQEWADQLPEGSLGKAMLRDEDAKTMPEHDYDLKEEMILRLLRHEATSISN